MRASPASRDRAGPASPRAGCAVSAIRGPSTDAAPKLWIELPEAQRLLAEAVQNPPAAHEFRFAFGEREWRYIGPIPRALSAIREPFLDQVLRGSDHAAKVLNFKLTVTQAIDDAREAAGVGQAEEGFHVTREAAE